MKDFIIYCIKFYQKIPGPWHDGCKFEPTCSNYAIEAIQKYGCVKGLKLSVKRVFRCRPGSRGGYDPVP